MPGASLCGVEQVHGGCAGLTSWAAAWRTGTRARQANSDAAATGAASDTERKRMSNPQNRYLRAERCF